VHHQNYEPQPSSSALDQQHILTLLAGRSLQSLFTSHKANGHCCRAVESYSDGAMGDSTGRLMFFLTSLDATGADVEVWLSAFS